MRKKGVEWQHNPSLNQNRAFNGAIWLRLSFKTTSAMKMAGIDVRFIKGLGGVIVAIGEFLLGSSPRRQRIYSVILAIPLTAMSLLASAWVGYLFGWLVGASLSPIAAVASPLVFGLLAAIGVHAGLQGKLQGHSSVWRAMLVAACVSMVCYSCYEGLKRGGDARDQPFKDLEIIVGGPDNLHRAGEQSTAELYAFQIKAASAGVEWRDYESFIANVIRPILEDDNGDKANRVRAALVTMEAALPEPKAKPEPSQEPAEPAD